jgi:hypothetical protein
MSIILRLRGAIPAPASAHSQSVVMGESSCKCYAICSKRGNRVGKAGLCYVLI